MTVDIGSRLRHAREDRGLSLHDAARLTKLSIAVLRAIERNDFARLPEGMFRKAYVRTLAAEVGLDPDEIARDYCAHFEPAPAAPDADAVLNRQLVRQLSASPRRSIVTLAALAAPAAAWFMLQHGYVRLPAPLEDTRRALVAVPMSGGGTMALAATPMAIAPHRAGVPLRIEMSATGWCWVAAETDGERALYRLVAPGERVVLEGRRMISLRLGDAGSVLVSINDGASRTFGGDGEVIEFEVTPDNVEGLRDRVAS